MTLEEIFERLNGVEGGADMAATIRKEITSLRNEAKSNRIAKEDILKALNLKNGEEGKQEAAALAALMGKLKEANATPDTALQKLDALEKSVKDLSDKYAAEQKKAAEAKARQQDLEKTSALVKALTNGHAASPSEIAKILSGNVSVKDDGSMVFTGADGKESSIDEGVTGYLKGNPWAVANGGIPGSGSQPPDGGNKKTYTMDDLKGMTPQEINAHWDDIKNSLKKG